MGKNEFDELVKEYLSKIKEMLLDAYQKGYEQGKQEYSLIKKYDDIEYVDLGLPSGTLWSFPIYHFDYGYKLTRKTYNEVKDLNLPTLSQWQEVLDHCRFSFEQGITQFYGANGARGGYRLCPNTSNIYPIYNLGQNCEPGHNKFWLKSEPDKNHEVDVIMFDANVQGYGKSFTGYNLPFFLVKNRNEM